MWISGTETLSVILRLKCWSDAPKVPKQAEAEGMA